ncbi:MAG: hypothetical protein PHP52_12790, partial [Bacteroidales bacterium]|nr:hypothetical protein [Bacteroidales bacterium]
MKKAKLLFIMMLFISSSMFSQWDVGGNPLNRFGVTKYTPGNNNFRSIGIGHKQSSLVDGWTNSNPPRAALHVNAHYLSNSPAFEPGHMIRTDGPSNQDNMWQMFTGTNYNNSIEKARFSVPANTNDLVIEACMGHSNIRFNLVHDRQRAILTDGHGQGHFGVGDDFSDPQHMIHVHTSPT